MSEQIRSSSRRYYHPKVVEHLASQYVLGTLTSLVHIRVERLAKDNTELEQAILYWQQRFSALDQQTKPLAPKEESWQVIAQHLADDAETTAQQRDTLLQPERLSRDEPKVAATKNDSIIEQLVKRIKSLFSIPMPVYALSFSMVFAVLVISNMDSNNAEDPLSYVAVLTESSGQAHMVATTYGESRKLIVNMISAQPTTDEESLELWVVSKTDAQIRSLGVLPKNQELIEQQLTVAEWRLIKDSESLIVTVEEAGGSAIGEPSDMIVSRGLCVRLQEWSDNA